MTSKNAYTSEEVKEYLEHINIPTKYRLGAQLNLDLDLDLLSAIQKYHLCRIPFDTVQIHYSPPPLRIIQLEPKVLFDKLIRRKHGGYCMEHNTLLYHILLALGFKVYTTGARPQKRVDGIPQGDYYGWTHMVNIVTLADGVKYVVDAGYGGDGAIRPVLLTENNVQPNIGKQEMRLTKDDQGPLANPSDTLWTYQTRNGPEKPWIVGYCFTEIEFTPSDFRIMSYFTSTHPESYMTTNLVAVRMLMSDEQIYGKIMLNGAALKQNTGGRTELLRTCETEDERISVLEEHFGIVLQAQEREAIKDSKARIE